MGVVTTEQVIRSLIYDENRDVVICKYRLALTETGRQSILTQALNVPGSGMLVDHRKQAAFFLVCESELTDAAFENIEAVHSLSFEFDGRKYGFVDIVGPGLHNHYYEWLPV